MLPSGPEHPPETVRSHTGAEGAEGSEGGAGGGEGACVSWLMITSVSVQAPPQDARHEEEPCGGEDELSESNTA